MGEFRWNAAGVFVRLRRSGEVVVLKNGRPIGLLIAANASTLDTLRAAAQRVRARLAITRLREVTARREPDPLKPADINALIRKARRKRAARR